MRIDRIVLLVLGISGVEKIIQGAPRFGDPIVPTCAKSNLKWVFVLRPEADAIKVLKKSPEVARFATVGEALSADGDIWVIIGSEGFREFKKQAESLKIYRSHGFYCDDTATSVVSPFDRPALRISRSSDLSGKVDNSGESSAWSDLTRGNVFRTSILVPTRVFATSGISEANEVTDVRREENQTSHGTKGEQRMNATTKTGRFQNIGKKHSKHGKNGTLMDRAKKNPNISRHHKARIDASKIKIAQPKLRKAEPSMIQILPTKSSRREIGKEGKRKMTFESTRKPSKNLPTRQTGSSKLQNKRKLTIQTIDEILRESRRHVGTPARSQSYSKSQMMTKIATSPVLQTGGTLASFTSNSARPKRDNCNEKKVNIGLVNSSSGHVIRITNCCNNPADEILSISVSGLSLNPSPSPEKDSDQFSTVKNVTSISGGSGTTASSFTTVPEVSSVLPVEPEVSNFEEYEHFLEENDVDPEGGKDAEVEENITEETLENYATQNPVSDDAEEQEEASDPVEESTMQEVEPDEIADNKEDLEDENYAAEEYDVEGADEAEPTDTPTIAMEEMTVSRPGMTTFSPETSVTVENIEENNDNDLDNNDDYGEGDDYEEDKNDANESGEV